MELISVISKKWLDAYVERPKSVLLIDSNDDSVLGSLAANFICTSLANNYHAPIINIKIEEESKSIGINDIRALQKSLQLKANNNSEFTRFIIISEAEKLTPEAQNSLLKLIEELPKNTVIIMVAYNLTNVLETIKSRCFVIPILPITESQALEYGLNNKCKEENIKRAYLLSDGNTTIFTNLLNDEKDPLYELVNLAKKFIQDSVFERQALISQLLSTKSEYSYIDFTHALKLTAKSGMRFANLTETKTHWKNILQTVNRTDEQVDRNVSEKLALLSLSVSL